MAEESVRVRSLSGQLLLDLPRPVASSLKAADLKCRLGKVVATQIADGITERRLWLTLGERSLDDDEVVGMFWPQDSGPLELQLAIRNTREDQIEQTVLVSLKAIHEVHAWSIADRLVAIDLQSAEELDTMVRTLFVRALADAPSCERYADVVVAVRPRCPEFHDADGGGKPATFTRSLVNACQNAFENQAAFFDSAGVEETKLSAQDVEQAQQERRTKLSACLLFIGCLFVRQVLGKGKIIARVVDDMIGDRSKLPAEYVFASCCEFIQIVGGRMGGSSQGRVLMGQFVQRIDQLRSSAATDRRNQRGPPFYSEPTRRLAEGVVGLQQMGWRPVLLPSAPDPRRESDI